MHPVWSLWESGCLRICLQQSAFIAQGTGRGKRETWGNWIREGLHVTCDAKAWEQRWMELLRLQQDLSRTAWLSPSYFASLHFTFQCSHFWNGNVLAWTEMHSAVSDPAERGLTKPCMLRKLVQNSDSGRPRRTKMIPLDLTLQSHLYAHVTQYVVCLWAALVVQDCCPG